MRACAILAVALLAGQINASEVSPITVRVEQISGNGSDNRFKHSQSKALKVHISNASAADAAGLRIKYYYFGKSLKEEEPSVLKQGEQKATILSLSTTTVETPEFETTYTEEHGKRVGGKGGPGGKGSKGGRRKNVRYKEVEASGTKLTGYGVKVFSGGQLVAEAYSEPGYKALAQ